MIRLARYAVAAKKLVGDNSPAILTAAAVVGVLTTAVLVAKAAPKAHQDIQNEKSERIDDVDFLDKTKLVWKYYIPAAAVGTATVACIIGANTISTKRSAALASAVGLSEYAFREYRDKVVEHLGEKKETKIHDEVMQDVVRRNPVSESSVIVTGGGRSLFLDNYSKTYFESDYESVRRAVNDINEQIFGQDYASLNDFYNRLSVPGSVVGDEVGWTHDNKLDVRYSAVLTADGRPCVAIDYRKNPIRDYNRFG